MNLRIEIKPNWANVIYLYLGGHIIGRYANYDAAQLDMNRMQKAQIREVKTYEIWMEGWEHPLGNGKAQFITRVNATSFQSACDYVLFYKVHRSGSKDWNFNYESRLLTLWDTRLYDNEADARKLYG